MDSLLDTAPCGYLCFGDDGVVRDVNRTLLETLGYQRDDVVGRHVEHILNIGTRIFYQTHWFPLLRLHGHAEEVYLIFRNESGASVGMLTYAHRRDNSYDCILVPVVARAKYEEELLRAKRAAEDANRVLEEQAVELEVQQEQLYEANQAKSAFLAVMSHELRTPLNAISGYVQILKMNIHGPLNDKQLEITDRLERSGHHLLHLINEVLNLSRIESGQLDYEIEDVHVGDAIESIRPLVEPLISERHMKLEVDVERNLMVRADLDKIRQVLINLIGNAVKFSDVASIITVHAMAQKQCVRIEVSDQGIGIPAGKIESIFEPFVQVDSSKTRKVQGSGLGLAISRDLARGMKGDLFVKSELGAGSTFIVQLPACKS